ncbi:MAG: hypothetical protein HOC77_09605 [Chloroflexi bacterium]|nr:hypothetical protein [Chloroflexota bacterium]MBT4073466.1 hypothetical protein [Chloroflexota bacterium]MBT4515329.1 hypothetical protein [Chloroflexota bacterium]MBT5320263.1 hypothetical protein [Chloroflexota bacterium]MBT6682247.1 hypothetical protein [Chloroflexota bacterium]
MSKNLDGLQRFLDSRLLGNDGITGFRRHKQASTPRESGDWAIETVSLR